MWSAFRVRRKILPEGAWMANFAGLSRPDADLVEEMADVDAENSLELLDIVEAPAVLDTMLRALDGRVNTDGEARPVPL